MNSASDDPIQQSNGRDDAPRELIREFVARLDAERSQLASKRDSLELEGLRRMGGSQLARMLDSATDAAKYLCDPDASLRFVALSILDRRFGVRHELRDQFLHLSQCDPDPAVRWRATLLLVKTHLGSNDAIAFRLLAEMVRDEILDEDTRVGCYHYLRSVVGDITEGPLSSMADIDWEFVDQFL